MSKSIKNNNNNNNISIKTKKIIVNNIPINGWVSPLALATLLASHNTNKILKNYKETLRKPKLCSTAALH